MKLVTVSKLLFDVSAYAKIAFGRGHAQRRNFTVPVVDPTLRLVDVKIGRHHIIVTRQHDRGFAGEKRFGVPLEAREPGELVIELHARPGIAVGNVRLAEADAFRPSFGLARREALWAIKALRDIPLPLLAAAEGAPAPETNDQAVALKAMTAGHEVIEDYGHVGLTLRRHPVSFLREELSGDGILTCAQANTRPNRGRIKLAGLVLVRQRPGTAKGVTFITIEDESGIANLVVWADLYERQRRTVLTANMLAIDGRVQREGLVVHIVVDKLIDLSDRLAAIGEQNTVMIPHGRGDNFRGDMPPDPRTPRLQGPGQSETNALKLKPRNFR